MAKRVKTNCFCALCDDRILGGEEYVENFEGKYAHPDCFGGFESIKKFFDISTYNMEYYEYFEDEE